MSLTVYQKLNNARADFHSLELKKTGHNKFANYYYFELGDFLIAALQVFHENGLCAYISFGKDLAIMTIVSVADGSKIELTSPMAEAQLKGCHPIQNLGAVETYTRRYLWVAALEIVEHDALDSSRPLDSFKDESVKIPSRPRDQDLDLDASTLENVKEIAKTVTLMVEGGRVKEALNYYKAAGMKDDMHIAFQNNVTAKVRSALKAENEKQKESK